MDKIELLDGNHSILAKDKARIKEIYDTFGYSANTKLVPQCFWGNIKDPTIIVLAKNPSCVASDYLDNKYFEKELRENLSIENRNHEIVNLLFSDRQTSGIPFELSGVSKWWRSFFSLNIDDTTCKDIMDSICIINLCGYYKTNMGKISEELFWFYDENKDNRINDVVEEVFKNKNLQHIICVWARNEDNQWNKIFKSLNIRDEIITCANKKNPYYPYIELADYLKKCDMNQNDFECDGVEFYYPIYKNNRDKNDKERYILAKARDYKMSTLIQMNEGEDPIFNNSDFICENMKMLLCWKANFIGENELDSLCKEAMESIDELHAILYALSYDENYYRYDLSDEEIKSIEELKSRYSGDIMQISKYVSHSFIKCMNQR